MLKPLAAIIALFLLINSLAAAEPGPSKDIPELRSTTNPF